MSLDEPLLAILNASSALLSITVDFEDENREWIHRRMDEDCDDSNTEVQDEELVAPNRSSLRPSCLDWDDTAPSCSRNLSRSLMPDLEHLTRHRQACRDAVAHSTTTASPLCELLEPPISKQSRE